MCRCGSKYSEFVLTTIRTNQRMTHTVHSGTLGNTIGNKLAVVTIHHHKLLEHVVAQAWASQLLI